MLWSQEWGEWSVSFLKVDAIAEHIELIASRIPLERVSGHDLVDHASVDVGKPKVATGVPIR